MKKILILVLFFIGIQSQAQSMSTFGKDPIVNLENWDKQRVYWGFFLGFNSFDFKTDYKQNQAKEISVDNTTGFNVGLVGNLRLSEYFDLRFEPGLYYTQRNLTYPNFTKYLDSYREVKSSLISFPFLLKYSALRTGNIRPFLVTGLSATLNLGSNANSKDDNAQQVFRLNSWSTNYELGFGIDLYFEYFKFSPSIRGVFGLNDELIRDNNPNSPWTSNIESMSTRAILVNFTFH